MLHYRWLEFAIFFLSPLDGCCGVQESLARQDAVSAASNYREEVELEAYRAYVFNVITAS